MKKFNAFLALVLFSGVGFAQTTWTIDKNHSKIGFNITHMAVAEVEGKFNDYSGTVVSKADDFNGAEVHSRQRQHRSIRIMKKEMATLRLLISLMPPNIPKLLLRELL